MNILLTILAILFIGAFIIMFTDWCKEIKDHPIKSAFEAFIIGGPMIGTAIYFLA